MRSFLFALDKRPAVWHTTLLYPIPQTRTSGKTNLHITYRTICVDFVQ
jgi:hypothetical protein